MILDEFKKENSNQGITYLSDIDHSFEQLYSQVLKREKRIYVDSEVKLLPYASERNPHIAEWESRTKSFLRFRDYLATKKSKLNILDVGCGNGWLIGQLAKEFNHNYFGIDLNLTEIEQANRLFSSENVRFIYGDITKAALPTDTFNIIILNSTLQYFKAVDTLLKELLTISKSYGEVHILDTQFYSSNDLILVKKNALKYYASIGFSEMANRYFHHTFDELKYFRTIIKYNPESIKNKISDFLFDKDSQYPWIIVTR